MNLPIKLVYGRPVQNGPDDVDYEEEEIEFDNTDDAILFLKGLDEELEKREAQADLARKD